MRFAKVGGSRWSRLVLVGVLLSSFGCVTKIPPSDGGWSVQPGEINEGAPDSLTMYDLESATRSLMSKMFGHPRFKKEYDKAKSANAGGVPCVDVRKIESKAIAGRIKDRLEMAQKLVRAALYDSELFDFYDPDSENFPAFVVFGEIRKVEDVGGCYTYQLYLQCSRNADDGYAVVWEGTQKLVKTN